MKLYTTQGVTMSLHELAYPEYPPVWAWRYMGQTLTISDPSTLTPSERIDAAVASGLLERDEHGVLHGLGITAHEDVFLELASDSFPSRHEPHQAARLHQG